MQELEDASAEGATEGAGVDSRVAGENPRGMSGRLSQPPDCPGCFSDFLGESGSVAGNSGRWPDGPANATDPGTSTGAFGCGVPVTSITAGVSLSLKVQGSGSGFSGTSSLQ